MFGEIFKRRTGLISHIFKSSIFIILTRLSTHIFACEIMGSIGIIHHFKDIAGEKLMKIGIYFWGTHGFLVFGVSN
jgi:hypothetical protein